MDEAASRIAGNEGANLTWGGGHGWTSIGDWYANGRDGNDVEIVYSGRV